VAARFATGMPNCDVGAATVPPLQAQSTHHTMTNRREDFELQPHLVGDLLEVRPLRPEDWESLFAVASDPLIWEQHPARDR